MSQLPVDPHRNIGDTTIGHPAQPINSTAPSRRGTKWIEGEDKELLEQLDSGMSIENIAAKHSRTVVAIKLRCFKILSEKHQNKEDVMLFCNRWHIDINEVLKYIQSGGVRQ